MVERRAHRRRVCAGVAIVLPRAASPATDPFSSALVSRVFSYRRRAGEHCERIHVNTFETGTNKTRNVQERHKILNRILYGLPSVLILNRFLIFRPGYTHRPSYTKIMATNDFFPAVTDAIFYEVCLRNSV